MSDYTIVNLGDVENVAPKFQMPEGMDVRFPKQDLGCKVGGVGIEKLPPGVRMPFGHTALRAGGALRHRRGLRPVKLDDEIHDLRSGTSSAIGPGDDAQLRGRVRTG